MQTIKPRTMSGFMELLPAEQKVFNNMKSIIEKTMNSFGLSTIDTPVLELSEILLAKAGGDTDKQIFRFNKGDTDITMRYDLTVPLAKYVSLYKNELCFPFKRYQIGKVFRGERPQKGRLREFYQCDADIIGDGELPIEADAEAIAILEKIYKNLKINSVIHISNRKILCGVLEELELSEKQSEILSLLDKLEKMGQENGFKELSLLVGDKAQRIFDVFLIKELEKLDELGIQNEKFKEGVSELKRVFELLGSMGATAVTFDLSIIRGLDYYTGTVFEGRLEEFPAISVGGGGRYDNLASYFSKDKMPGVGFGMGLSRLFVLLKELGKLEFTEQTETKLALIPIGIEPDFCFNLANEFRDTGLSTQVLYSKSFKARMNLANKLGVPYIIVVGEDEVKSDIFGLKDMKTGETEKLTLPQLKEKLWTV